ncbi:MAG: metallophosphoesterase [Planctomycetaceae bacterium]
MEFDLVLAGSYESALLRPEPMEEIWPTMVIAGRSLMRLRDQLTDWRQGEESLRSLSPSFEWDGAMNVHGSPREPGEYLCPEDIYNLQKMEKVWAAFELLCSCGHTHIPSVMTTSEFVTPDECGLEVPVDRKLICKGAVGQPGDGDSRACYVPFDGQTIRFRRVPYDYEKAIAKIRDNGDDDFSGYPAPRRSMTIPSSSQP